ncbi:hypothetical protein EVAR_77333_1 [Eumeta japonica]|uniref:Uncharacterized protein n=1 Tax=Eumeta variegata TaxID=151549 RepID=A0A4C1UX57_EUMVA|nr:hypothetical protein EVAR_77333_1 [Eumeta japonica]
MRVRGCRGRTKRTTGPNTYLNVAAYLAQCRCVPDTVLYFGTQSSGSIVESSPVPLSISMSDSIPILVLSWASMSIPRGLELKPHAAYGLELLTARQRGGDDWDWELSALRGPELRLAIHDEAPSLVTVCNPFIKFKRGRINLTDDLREVKDAFYGDDRRQHKRKTYFEKSGFLTPRKQWLHMKRPPKQSLRTIKTWAACRGARPARPQSRAAAPVPAYGDTFALSYDFNFRIFVIIIMIHGNFGIALKVLQQDVADVIPGLVRRPAPRTADPLLKTAGRVHPTDKTSPRLNSTPFEFALDKSLLKNLAKAEKYTQKVSGARTRAKGTRIVARLRAR